MTDTAIPVDGKGNANWVDYSSYWREKDADFLMERTVLRYADAAARTTQYPTPKFGQITYNEASDRLESFSKVANAWSALTQYINLTSTQDTTAGVAISHKLAGSKGIVFQPTQTLLDNPISVMNGVLTVNATAVGVKTGVVGAKLTTTATELVLENQNPATPTAITLKVPNLNVTGTLTGVTANLTSLTVPNMNVSGTINGGTFSGAVSATSITAPVGTLAAPTGVMGGVSLGGSFVSAPNGGVFGSTFIDGVSNLVRWRNPTTGALSNSMMNPTLDYIRWRTMSGMPLDNTAGAWTQGWVGFVFTVDPGAANAPPGSILFL